MPQGYGSEEERRARGPFYAILKRIEAQKEFFERAWKIRGDFHFKKAAVT
jgi:hypothetical protein